MNTSDTNQQKLPIFNGFLASRFDWLFVFGTIALLPLLVIEAGNLWNRPQYQFFPFSFLVFAFLLFSRSALKSTNSKKRKIVGLAANLIAVAFIAVATIRYSPWLAHVAFILLLFGWMILRLGANQWHAIVAWTAVIAVTIPLPLNMDSKLVQSLQSISAFSASKLIDLTGIPHLQKGMVLQVEQKELFVDQACSGIDSLYALSAVTIILIAIQRVPFLISLLTLICIPVWAWAGNLIRLYVIVLAIHKWNIDLSEGWQHTVLGLLIFLLVFLGVISSMGAIATFFKPLGFGEEWAHKLYDWIAYWPAQRTEDANSTNSTSSSTMQSNAADMVEAADAADLPKSYREKLVASAVVLMLLVCGVIASGKALGVGPWRRTHLISRIDKGSVEANIQRNTLPEKIGKISIDGFEIAHREQNALMGEFSAIWHGVDDNLSVYLSLDFPFADRHFLEECFVLTGSTISSMADQQAEGEHGPEYIRDATLLDQLGQPTFISYCIFHSNGQSLRENNPLLERLFPTQLDGLVYQLQINVSNSGELNREKKAEYHRLLLDLKKRLLPIIRELESQ